jgi:hypothetical protein
MLTLFSLLMVVVFPMMMMFLNWQLAVACCGVQIWPMPLLLKVLTVNTIATMLTLWSICWMIGRIFYLFQLQRCWIGHGFLNSVPVLRAPKHTIILVFEILRRLERLLFQILITILWTLTTWIHRSLRTIRWTWLSIVWVLFGLQFNYGRQCMGCGCG